MTTTKRTFTIAPAVRKRVPLLLGITGASGSGKTFSALRMATGINRVAGGRIAVIDTEADRALHYAGRFDFDHIAFRAPFGPLDYLQAIEFAVSKGATTIIVDNMSNEHNGPGGVMDQIDQFLDKRCGDDEPKRRRLQMMANIGPKRDRLKLNNRIVQLGINAIFLYRASEKIKPVPGSEPENLGWQAQTTSPLIWDLTQRFLLEPGSDGVPTFKPDKVGEKQLVKSPEQFRAWFTNGQQLDEAIGERMARWAAGDEGEKKPAAKTPGGAPAGEAKPAIASMVADIYKAADALKWARSTSVEWLGARFGPSARTVADLTPEQVEIARELLIALTVGEAEYRKILAGHVANGRAKP